MISNTGGAQTTTDGSQRGSGGAVNQGEKKNTQTTEHVGEIVNTTQQSHTTEEVEREKTIDRHENKINIIEQPLKQEEHLNDQVYHQNTVPVTEIEENHGAADKDVDALRDVSQKLNGAGSIEFKPDERKIVDKGENVTENVHTHTQNIVVPVVDKEVHEYHTEKTIIPTHQTINSAPTVNKTTREPMSREGFLKTGG